MTHVALNAYKTKSGGILNYIETIVTKLPLMYPDCQYTIFLNQALDHLPKYDNVTHVYLDDTKDSLFKRLYWEQYVLPKELKRLGVDVLYTFSVFDVLLAHCPTVVRIGNMAPFHSKAIEVESSFQARIRLRMLSLLSRLSFITSNATLVQSEYAADILRKQQGFKGEKLKGINRGYDVEDIMDSEFDSSYVSGYFLCVSHMFRYKMLIEVVQAYKLAKMKSNDGFPQLLIAGGYKDAKYTAEIIQEIEHLELKRDVILLGNVERGKLHDLIRNCKASVFSSLVETFPTTLFEQMGAQVPLIVGRSGVMPSFCGDSVLYYDMTDPNDLCSCLLRLNENDKLCEDLALQSFQRFKSLTLDWDTALKMRQELFELLATGGH